MPERSKDWLAQAERDLEVAQSVLKDGFYEWGCFISQQAAEKAVKGLFQYLHAEAWGHSLTKLLKQLPDSIRPSGELIKVAHRLDKYYILPRYPNGFDSGAPKDYFDLEDTEGAIQDAIQIIKFCQSKIRRQGKSAQRAEVTGTKAAPGKC